MNHSTIKKVKKTTSNILMRLLTKKPCKNNCSTTKNRPSTTFVKNSFTFGIETRTCKSCCTEYTAVLTPIGYIENRK